MNNDEYTRLLRHLRTTARESGLGTFDRRAMERVNLEIDSPPRFKVMQYLNALYEEVALNSSDLATRILTNLNRQIDNTEPEGSGIDRLLFELELGDRSDSGASEIELTGSRGLAQVLREIEALRDLVADDDHYEPPPLRADV